MMILLGTLSLSHECPFPDENADIQNNSVNQGHLESQEAESELSYSPVFSHKLTPMWEWIITD